MAIILNEKQKQAISLAVLGHNFVLMGPAGTGKTHLLKEIYQTLNGRSKRVHITCTTGIACVNFGTHAETIHRWAGLEDGRYSSTEICNLIKTSPKYNHVLQRIMSTDVLIIDEISMLSAKLFDQVLEICAIKDPSKHLGGIQLIVSGDYYQLPPVPNKMYKDEGAMSFTSTIYQKVLPHRVVLTEVVRQDDEPFIHVISEISKGNVSPETVSYVSNLQGNLSDKALDTSIKLFANNDLVDVYYRRKILEGTGNIREYVSSDSGDKHMLLKSIAPARLWLKEGCPVLLIRNLSNIMVNGLQGTVVDFEDNNPVVHFASINMTTKLEKVSFTVFDPEKNMTVATRVQVPLKLAYAITIHKAQGMTLDRVVVDCQQIFKPGQLGVAMGRVRTAAGLRVVNFHPSVCLSHPDEIHEFVQRKSLELDEHLNCCRNHKRTDETVKNVTVIGSDEVLETADFLEEFDEELDQVLSEIDTGGTITDFELPENFNINQILKDCMYTNPLTPDQIETNDLVNQLLTRDNVALQEFCKKEFQSVSNIVDEMDIHVPTAVKPETLTEFYRKCYNHTTSDSYRIACTFLFEHCHPFGKAQSHICLKISNAIRQFLITERAKLFPVSSQQKSTRNVTDASKARIRYVGGYCLSKITQKYLRLQRSRMYLLSAEKQLEFDAAAEKVNILNSLREEENYLKTTTSAQDSLIDVTRKQNVNRGLFHIPDDLFYFFVQLSEQCLKLLNEDNLQLHGENIHSYCLAELVKSTSLFQMFSDVITSRKTASFLFRDVSDTPSCLISKLFEEIVEIFFMVMFNQYRKDLVQTFSVAKTMAHRKQILVKKQKKESTSLKTVTFTTIENDQTENKKMSHTVVQGLILTKVDVFSVMTKVQIQKLLKAYNVKFKASSNKLTLIKMLEEAIIKCESMPNSSVIGKTSSSTEPSASSTSVDINKPSTSSMDTGSLDEDLCKMCHEGEIGVDWISCNTCDGWLHRTCAKIGSNEEWEKLSKQDAIFLCPECSLTN